MPLSRRTLSRRASCLACSSERLSHGLRRSPERAKSNAEGRRTTFHSACSTGTTEEGARNVEVFAKASDGSTHKPEDSLRGIASPITSQREADRQPVSHRAGLGMLELIDSGRMLPLRVLGFSAVVWLPLAAGAQPAPTVPVLIDCAGEAVSRPATIQISCADGGILVSDIRWTSWDGNGAKGQGNLVVNSCIYTGGPSCVEGQTMSYAASLSLTRPASGDGITALTELKLRFRDAGPAGLRSGTYRIEHQRRP